MPNSKDDLIAELYALRAGLSAVSIEAEAVKNNRSAISVEANKVQPLYPQLQNIEQQVECLSNELNQTKTNHHNQAVSRNSQISAYLKSIGIFKRLATYYAILLPIITIAATVMILANVEIIHEVFFGIAYLPLLVGGIILIVLSISTYREYFRSRKQFIADLDKNIADLAQRVNDLTKSLANAEKQKRDIESKLAEAERQRDSNVEMYNERIAAHTEKALSYSHVLQEKFSSLLNPADWQNVDLYIFYFQTGRADTLKECLQLVDRQVQTDEIVNAIHYASERIYLEIKNGFSSLGKTVLTCFNSISAQMEGISNQIVNEHAALDKLGSAAQMILTSTQLNNALLAKANVSSEQLVNDLNFIKQYS